MKIKTNIHSCELDCGKRKKFFSNKEVNVLHKQIFTQKSYYYRPFPLGGKTNVQTKFARNIIKCHDRKSNPRDASCEASATITSTDTNIIKKLFP